MMAWLRWLLLPLALLYQLVVTLRHWLYDRGVLPVHRLPVPVISVGNIQMGGTGKTPLVLTLVEWLQQQGIAVGVLTRGYRRQHQQDVVVLAGKALSHPEALLGDEPTLIWQALKAGALGVGQHRARVAEQLLQQVSVDALILDDGLQHRALHRDVDICLIDVSRWRYPGVLFPVSYFRDVPRVLRRVSAILLTKWEFQQERLASVQREIQQYTTAPMFTARLQAVGFRNLRTGQVVELHQLLGQSVVAVSGIANPHHFENTLQENGLQVQAILRFGDHHHYRPADLQTIGSIARRNHVLNVVTTEKDAVKWLGLPGALQDDINWWALLTRLEVSPQKEWQRFLKHLLEVMGRRRGTQWDGLA